MRGYVGGADFDSDLVSRTLTKYKDRPVTVLIDSLGGSLATALSIAAAFREHGDVTAHFVGMNASAATIASMGAKSITIDECASQVIEHTYLADNHLSSSKITLPSCQSYTTPKFNNHRKVLALLAKRSLLFVPISMQSISSTLCAKCWRTPSRWIFRCSQARARCSALTAPLAH